jgi:hypothetical protein
VEDVAANADFPALQVAEAIAERQNVEQSLCRMLVGAVPGVDDIGLDPLRQELGGARGGMTDDDHIDAHCFQIARGVDQRLSFRHARSGRGDVHRIGRQPLFRELEGDPRSGRVLEEQIDDR